MIREPPHEFESRGGHSTARRPERKVGTVTDEPTEPLTLLQSRSRGDSSATLSVDPDDLPHIFFSTTAGGVHDYVNAASRRFVGHSIAEARPQWSDLVHSRDRHGAVELWTSSLRSGEPYEATYRFRHASGHYRWLRAAAVPVYGAGGRIVRWNGLAVDAQETTDHIDRLIEGVNTWRRRAEIDGLTQLLNRQAFFERAAGLRLSLFRERRSSMVVVIVDVDLFKDINDTYGHRTGDEVIARTARQIASAVGPAAVVGRLGGDEFVIVHRADTPYDVELLLRRIREHVNLPYTPHPLVREDILHGRTFTVSMGACFGPPEVDLGSFLDIADRQLYRAKASGRNTFAMSYME